MRFANEQAWDELVAVNTSDYGRAIVAFAQRWADAMEAAMAAGETLEQCADRTSHEVDTACITGMMATAAAYSLKTSWKHGDRLWLWYTSQESQR